MHLSPLVAFFLWIPAGIYLFHRYSPRVAILFNFFGGWALLPGADYKFSAEYFPYWILGVCLPSNYFLTKATVTGFAALAGWLIFHARNCRGLRAALCDLPVIVWCCVPLLSSLSQGNSISEGIFGAVYQTLAWGVPWLLGRIYFSDHDSLLLFAKACVIGGICYVPLCLLEWITGPQLYALLYGYQPYRLVGAQRYFGSRPIGFLEDGNQLGIWMAAAALLAASLAFHHLADRIFMADRIFRFRMGAVAWVLAAITLLCQSAGSILLYLFLLPFNLLKRRTTVRAAVLAATIACFAAFVFLIAQHASIRSIAANNRLIRFVAYTLEQLGRHSFAWRLARDESHMAVALRKPLLGYGQWDWWRTGDARPWSLWLLVFGMYGIVGLGALSAFPTMPVFRTVFSSAWDNRPAQFQLRLALSGLIVMVALDGLLNGAVILPYLLAMAGMSSPWISTKATRSIANPPIRMRR